MKIVNANEHSRQIVNANENSRHRAVNAEHLRPGPLFLLRMTAGGSSEWKNRYKKANAIYRPSN
ncbi:MAG: hypothetical protein JXR70_11080 [Spirochaetales bacterium]|nr:hypothetical protein [Spirochaetales bacterium]